MQKNPYTTEITSFSHTTAVSCGLFRNRRRTLIFATAVAFVLGLMTPGLTGAAHAQTGNLPLPRIKTHAPAGFRLYRPGYRLAGKGVMVSAQLCRLSGYASASPQYLLVERLEPSGQLGESHEQYLPRLGMRMGNNCSFASVRLDAVPTYGETIKICATSGRANCP